MKRLALLILVVYTLGCTNNTSEKIVGKAADTRDQSLCEKLSDPRLRINCSFEIALKYENTTMCEKIGDDDWSNQCIMELAVKKKDLQLCKSLKSEKMRNECLRKASL